MEWTDAELDDFCVRSEKHRRNLAARHYLRQTRLNVLKRNLSIIALTIACVLALAAGFKAHQILDGPAAHDHQETDEHSPDSSDRTTNDPSRDRAGTGSRNTNRRVR